MVSRFHEKTHGLRNLGSRRRSLTTASDLIIIKIQRPHRSSRMSIWNKILAWFVGITALAFFYLAARTLQTHAYWKKTAQSFEQAIKKVDADNKKLLEGDPKAAQVGIRQINIELDKVLLDRRRVWTNCEAKARVGREDGSAEVLVTIDRPDPPGIADNTVLYAFEETPVEKRGRYLGEFKVTKVAGKDVTLAPTSMLNTRELDRLAVAKQPWILYEIMPRDNHETLARLSGDQKKAMLPADTLQEYLKDGKPADKDDPAERVADGNYVRQLRDYQVLFDNDVENRTVMDQRLKAVTQDTNLLKVALDQAQKQEEVCKADIATAKEELAKITRERTLVADVSKAIDAKVAEVGAEISKLLEKNQAMAGHIAQQQLDAAERIDQRTRAMAQSGTRGR